MCDLYCTVTVYFELQYVGACVLESTMPDVIGLILGFLFNRGTMPTDHNHNKECDVSRKELWQNLASLL